jgi:uncharacterized OsmC-like protein
MSQEKHLEASATVFWEGALKTRAVVRGFEVYTDKPRQSFGTNSAPAPAELFITAIGSCFLATFVWAAMKARVEFEDVKVKIKADTVEANDEAKITGSVMTLTAWGKPYVQEKLQRCFELSKSHCTLTNSVSFPLELVFEFKAEE